MADAKERSRPGLSGAPELDELQRGQERPVTVETLERAAPDVYKEMREIPVPDPGERPGAVRMTEEGTEEADEGERA